MKKLKQLQDSNCEIIIVDGGSTDNSADIARKTGFNVRTTTRGRAHQMNVGAKQATGSVLVFLHADTQLPYEADFLIRNILSDQSLSCWGYFKVRIAGDSKLLNMVSLLMNLRSYFSGIITGDQTIFIKKETFLKVGCFPEQLLMEDIELSKRLNKIARPVCIDSKVITSGRRWETYGIWRTIFLMWRLRWDYWRGIPADQLAGKYK